MENEEAHDAGPAVDPAALEHGAEGDGLHATTEVAHGEEAGGMPQLNPDFFGNQIFWLLVSLVAIFLMLTRVALPRIGATLATRQGTISSDLAAAETFRAQAREAQVAYDKALAEARAEAGRIGAETRAQIQAQLAAELAQADARIDAKSAESAQVLRQIQDEAAANVELVARDTARAIVEALGGRPDDAAVDGAVLRATRS
jgi:F-type H+-transporting ATPase subunit b